MSEGNNKYTFPKTLWSYVCSNKTAVLIVSLGVILGATNPFNNLFPFEILPYKSWELAALMSTMFYSIFLHINGGKNNHYKGIGENRILKLLIPNGLLIAVVIVLAYDFSPNNNMGRIFSLFLLIITISCFLWVNWDLYKAYRDFYKDERHPIKERLFYQELSEDYRKTVLTSDLPLLISMAALFLYFIGMKLTLVYHLGYWTNEPIISIILSNTKDNADTQALEYSLQLLEYFMSGAIAFQMTYSNAVWIFNDDKIFMELPEKDDEWDNFDISCLQITYWLEKFETFSNKLSDENVLNNKKTE